jgi:serine/threonine protein kinase
VIIHKDQIDKKYYDKLKSDDFSNHINSLSFCESVESEEKDNDIYKLIKPKYIYIEEIGEGSYGQVIKAIHVDTQQYVAIKVI